jgi:hypothetical protein
MPIDPHPKRRDFLKTAAAGAAGAMGISALRFDKLFAQSTGGWVSGMQVNPAIDNKRVICCHDPKMLGNYPSSGAVSTVWASQNSYVDPATVSQNLEQMAMQLAQKNTAADAWSTIFQKPTGKAWASTKVAIKVNAIQSTTGNHPRVAIVKKICDVLIDQLGVSAANIIVCDAHEDPSLLYNTTYVSLTDATKIRATVSKYAQSLGGMVPVTIAASTKSISAVGDLVNGVIDILVNIAVLKVHSGPGTSYQFGSCSLCMKNHLGTFINQGTYASPSSTGLHSLDAICNINKHAAILGGNPVRQQLCIVDGLMANGGNSATANVRADRIVMGTFAPIVDYLTATSILLNSTIMATGPMPALGVTNAAVYLPQFLTSFGYSATDTLQWVECTPPNWPAITGGSGGSSGSGGAGSGGTSATGGAGSGGTSGAGGARNGGTNAAGGTASGGTSSAGGTTSGGTSGSGGAAGGGTRAAGGARSGGTSAAGGAGNGGTSAAGGVGSGGAAATGGTPGSGGTTTSGGAGGTGGAATASASGGSATTGGTSAGTRTGASATGGSSGTATATSANSGGGCDVVGGDRRVTRWGAMLAFGAVVAERLRRLVSSGDRS